MLVADPDEQSRRQLSAALAAAGMATREVATAEAALAALDEQRPAAVIVDSRLPGIGAPGLLSSLRDRLDTRKVPVLLLTPSGDVDDHVRGLRMGASDSVTLPASVDEVVARVQAQVRLGVAWQQELEARLGDRRLVTEALARLRADGDAAHTAEQLVEELVGLPDVTSAAVVDMVAPHPRILAATGPHPPRCDTEGRVEPYVIESLRRAGAQGPRMEAARPIPAEATVLDHLADSECLITAPVTVDGERVAVLAAVVPSAVTRTAQPALAAVLDFAAVSGMLFADALAESEDVRRVRQQLGRILARRAFTPVFEPVVALRSGRVVGFEALTRFADGTSPVAYFEQAARIGLSDDLEQLTMQAATDAAHRLPEGVWLSLNARVGCVLRGVGRDLVAAVQRPVVLELTEHDPVDDYAELRRALDGYGPVDVAVDDAGAGYASLSHVLALRPRFVKFDRSWITGIDTDRARQALIAGLGSFAERIGASVVAEGVESAAEQQTLVDLGVELGQGWHLGAPVTGDRLPG